MILVLLSAIAGVVAGLASRRVVEDQTGAPASALLLGTLTGGLAALAAWRFGAAWELPAYLYFAAVERARSPSSTCAPCACPTC